VAARVAVVTEGAAMVVAREVVKVAAEKVVGTAAVAMGRRRGRSRREFHARCECHACRP
jgi:hypothetical protein